MSGVCTPFLCSLRFVLAWHQPSNAESLLCQTPSPLLPIPLQAGSPAARLPLCGSVVRWGGPGCPVIPISCSLCFPVSSARQLQIHRLHQPGHVLADVARPRGHSLDFALPQGHEVHDARLRYGRCSGMGVTHRVEKRKALLRIKAGVLQPFYVVLNL